jgi:hypothetical protein
MGKVSNPGGSHAGVGAASGCPKCKITSKTVAPQPANRARKKIGVGEEVTLTFSLGSATWTTTSGELLANTGPTVNFKAGDVAGKATVTAKGSGCTASIRFKVVAPKTVHMDRISDVEHYVNYATVGMRTQPYIGPDDVSFYNIKYHEVDVPATATGVYACQNGKGHDAHPATLNATTTVTKKKGTMMNANDHVYSGHCGLPPKKPKGTEHFGIPYEYRVGTKPFHRFATVAQDVSCAPNGALKATKAGAVAKTTIKSATVTI